MVMLMNKFLYVIICLFLLVLNIGFYLYKTNITTFKYNITNVSKEENQITEDYEKSKISILFPNSKYNDLNEIIIEKIDKYIDTFIKKVEETNQESSSLQSYYYTLFVTYKEYNYQNYISYVFRIETFLMGAHPNHEIWTIVYDKVKRKVITLADLLKENKNTLDVFSKTTRKNLLYDKRIVDTTMFMEGTAPKKANFTNFVFSKDGIILFFPQYSIAPYSQGEFNTVVKYNLLKN